MYRLNRIVLLILLAFAGINCQKELSYIGGPDTGNLHQPLPISATVQGNIVDENNQPLANVHITAGGHSTVTDAKGFFRIPNAALDANSSVVIAEREGYFRGYRSFRATSGTNHVVISLLSKDLAGTLTATAGGEVSLANGTKITFPAGSIATGSGNAYSGTVQVYAHYIEPYAANFDRYVPGSLMADNGAGQRVALASFAMVAVELETPGGEPLQIKEGQTASLALPIPANLQASAPATIALWYLDKTKGIWKEEGSATRDGNVYKGTVKHFSFWNCDVGFPAVSLSLTLKNSDGQPLVNSRVRLSINSSSPPLFTQAYGYTDSLGQVSGLVPANYAITLEVLSECNTTIYSQNIPALTQNTNLGVITINNSTNIITVNGKVLNCNSNPVTNGYAVISLENMSRYISVDANGNFSLTFTVCSSTVSQLQALGVDLATQQQGTAVTLPATLPVTQTGNLSACGVSASQFINYLYDAINYSFSNVNPADSIMAYMNAQGQVYNHRISAMRLGTSYNVEFGFNTNTPSGTAGSYPMTSARVNYFALEVVQPSHINITHFPTAVGEFYEGSISGQARDSMNVTHTLNGTFRVRKNF